MAWAQVVEFLYLGSGLLLPVFYVPQIVKLWNDDTRLGSYSLSKATAQLLLRLPALAFALFIVNHTFMTVVLTTDVIGRFIEFLVAIRSLRKQGVSVREVAFRFNSSHAFKKHATIHVPPYWADDAWGHPPVAQAVMASDEAANGGKT